MKSLLFAVGVILTSSVLATPNVFNIQLVFDNSVNDAQKAVFNAARARWESVIKNDIGGKVTIAAGERVCGQAPLAADLVVDDILIFAKVAPIDGEGGAMASGGPCGFSGQKVRLGAIQIDSADVTTLENAGTFASTILHQVSFVDRCCRRFAQIN